MQADVANALRYLMCRQGMSQAELVRRTGMPRSTVSRVVRGENTPWRKHQYRFAAALGVSVDEFAEIATSPEVKLFEDATVRAVAKAMPLAREQRNEIVRFINQHCPRRTAA